MEAYQGVFPVPHASDWAKRSVSNKYAFWFGLIAVIIFGTIATGIIYYVTTESFSWFPLVLFGELIFMRGIHGAYRGAGIANVRILQQARDKEIIFHSDHVEFAAPILTAPEPSDIWLNPHPYLRVMYRDIERIQIVAKLASKTPPYLILHLKDKSHVTFMRLMFDEVEKQFLDALKSNGVTAQIEGFEYNR